MEEKAIHNNSEIEEKYNILLKLSDDFRQKMEMEKRRLPYHINVIDELHINENGHSRVLCKLLCYTNAKGEYEFLESLVKYIIRTSRVSEFERIKIVNPKVTQEISRIDLWVRDREKKYAIIFENKIYNASDQEAQISRYIEKTIADGYDKKNIFVVYLSQSGSQSGNNPDPQSWGNYFEEFSSRYVNLAFNHDILLWLKQEVFPNIREKDAHLKSAVHQYIDYLDGLFFLRTIDNTMNMNLDKFISDHLKLEECKDDKERACLIQEKMNDLQNLIQKMQSLKDKTRQNIIEEWRKTTRERFPELHPLEKGALTDVTFDSINYKKTNVVIGVDNNGLYCQVQIDNEIPQENRQIDVEKFRSLRKSLTEPARKVNNCIWKYFPQDDYDNVFNLFLEIVERCKKLRD